MPKSPNKALVVKVGGKVLAGTSNAEIFCEAVQKLIDLKGIQTVCDACEENQIILDGEPIVKKESFRAESAESKDLGSGFFLNTHSSTDAKAAKLRKLCQILGLPWTISVG